MGAAKNYPAGLADGTPISGSPGNTTTSGDGMTGSLGTGASLYASTANTFDSQLDAGEVWHLINGSTATTRQFSGLSETSLACKETFQWSGVAMPGVAQRVIDVRSASATAFRCGLDTSDRPIVQDSTGATLFTGTALSAGVEYVFELAGSLSATVGVIKFNLRIGNDPTVVQTFSTATANTGTATITTINLIQAATAAGGTWGADVGGFQYVGGTTTFIGPEPASTGPVAFVMPACQPAVSQARGMLMGLQVGGAAVAVTGGRSMALTLGATGVMSLQMPPSVPTTAVAAPMTLSGPVVAPLSTPPVAVRNSLIYGGLELLGGVGSTYNILTGDRNLGNAQVVNTTVDSPFLDGALVTGTMLGNRTISLNVLITASSRLALSAATEALLKICYSSAPVDLQWAPLNGLPVVFDTFRGVGNISWQSAMEGVFARQVSLQFDALPAGRSPVRLMIGGSSGAVTVMDFSNPGAFTYHTPDPADGTVYQRTLGLGVASAAPTIPEPILGVNHGPITTDPYPADGVASTQIDTQPYCIAAAYTYTYYVTLVHVGPVPYTGTVPAAGNALARVDTGPVTLNLAATTNLRIASFCSKNVALALTLRDSHGASVTVPFNEIDGSFSNWSHFTLDLSTVTGIDLTSITSLSLYVSTGDISGYTTGMPTVPVVLSPMRAFPATSSLTTTTNASVLRFAGMQGTVPAPVAFAINKGGVATMSGILLYRAPAGTAQTTPVLLALVGGVGTTPAPSTLRGTYRIVIGAPSSAYGVTIQQNLNGVPIPGAIWTSIQSSGLGGVPMGPNYSDLGEVTLPLVDTPGTVSGTTYTIQYQSGQNADLMFLDTQGRLLWVPSFTPAPYLWVDEATASGLGGVWAGPSADETDAQSVLGSSVAPQINGAFTLSPGDNYVLIHCPDGLPSSIVASYAPRFLAERST